MSRGRQWRLGLVAVLLVFALFFVWRTRLDPTRVGLFITAVIGAVTTIYVAVTYEIMLQNQSMAKAAVDSATFMERGLRFSHAPNLLFETINVKDPNFSGAKSIIPFENDDYKRAQSEYSSGGSQKEFVFAVLHNKGQGAATDLSVVASYDITESSNPNSHTTVKKEASVQILEPRKSVAVCIFISKVPAPNDAVTLVSAHITASDFYREAIGELPQEVHIDVRKHRVESEEGCVVRLA